MVDIERLPSSSTFEPWERDLLHAIPSFLLNYTRYRDWFETVSVEDINQLTGQSDNKLSAADAAAMQTIADDDLSRDEEWVRAMHRRTLRLSMIIAGTDPDDKNPLFHKLDPILNPG